MQMVMVSVKEQQATCAKTQASVSPQRPTIVMTITLQPIRQLLRFAMVLTMIAVLGQMTDLFSSITM